MKHAFKLTLKTFFVAAMITVSILLLAALNSLCLVAFGEVITVPAILHHWLLIIFKIAGIVTLITFPAVLTSIMVKNYYDRTSVREGQMIVLFSSIFIIFFIVLPIVLLLLKEDYLRSAMWAGIALLGLVIGDAAKKYPFPKLYA